MPWYARQQKQLLETNSKNAITNTKDKDSVSHHDIVVIVVATLAGAPPSPHTLGSWNRTGNTVVGPHRPRVPLDSYTMLRHDRRRAFARAARPCLESDLLQEVGALLVP